MKKYLLLLAILLTFLSCDTIFKKEPIAVYNGCRNYCVLNNLGGMGAIASNMLKKDYEIIDSGNMGDFLPETIIRYPKDKRKQAKKLATFLDCGILESASDKHIEHIEIILGIDAIRKIFSLAEREPQIVIINASSFRKEARKTYYNLKRDEQINLKFFKLQEGTEKQSTTEIYVPSKYLNIAERSQEIIKQGEIRKNKNLLDIIIILGDDLEFTISDTL